MRKGLRALLMDGWEAELQAGKVLCAGGLLPSLPSQLLVKK